MSQVRKWWEVVGQVDGLVNLKSLLRTKDLKMSLTKSGG